MSTFKNHFSGHSALYAQYRPNYPLSLFAYLASLTPGHQLAWDCGTGNGQAAVGLATVYQQVIATDPSHEQIGNAQKSDRIEYRVEMAERSSLAAHSADIVTIANALHWMHFGDYYEEVRRVVKPGGIIAAWSYALPTVSPEMDELIRNLHNSTLGDYWLPENRLVELKYSTIPFPFELIDAPDFYLEKELTLEELIGYLNTWSAVQRYLAKNQTNPTDALADELISYWGEPTAPRKIAWKLAMKIGRI